MTSPFDGTWRPRYEPPRPDTLPDVHSLADGVFECQSCHPPFRVPADGGPHAVDANPRFEWLEVTVADDRTVQLTGRRNGAVTYRSTMHVAADGDHLTETYTAVMPVGDVLVPITSNVRAGAGGEPEMVMFRAVSERVGSKTPGAHLVSGRWRVLEIDLLDHDEDTTYRLADGRLSMSDRLGRSYTAQVDGAIAPYVGDPRFTGVSVRQIDEWTIEESNLSGDAVVQVTTWHVDADGQTMHVRFDDTHGGVMEQAGYRIA
ncbi:MAG TPA: hypothetical protein VFP22_03655 [Candidatus Limnocylindrales bacterium]|nr:hypothetical protein [Candidatus Limnocylindrales bacterium]